MSSTKLLIALAPVVLLVLNSFYTAATPYPGDRDDFWTRLFKAIGRYSFLRHGDEDGDSPGTLHRPGALQPPPRDEVAEVLARLPPVPPRPPALGLLPVFVLLLALLPACQSFAALAQVAHRIYQAASDAEVRAADPATKASARACGKAGLDAERAALAAQQALTDDAPGYSALKVAADAAEKAMHKACDPLKLDGSSVPPPVPDMPRPADLHAAPDMGSGAAAPAAHDMGMVPRG